jgi:hypothetical protein
MPGLRARKSPSATLRVPPTPRHAHRVSRAPNLNLDQAPVRHLLLDRVDAPEASDVAKVFNTDPTATLHVSRPTRF